MGRKLESFSVTAMKAVGNHLEQNAISNLPKKTKRTIADEIKDLKSILLDKLKNGTSISKTNHMIDVVTRLDEDGVERLYFHAKNMNYDESHPMQQDCYGRIDEKGIVEVYISREPTIYDKDTYVEPYSAYSEDEKARIDQFKSIVTDGLEKIIRENREWEAKSFFSKIFSKKPKDEENIRNLLRKLPDHLKEVIKEASFNESISVKPEDMLEGNQVSHVDGDKDRDSGKANNETFLH